MEKIELNVHIADGGNPKVVQIAADATVGQLLKELQAAGAAIGESGDEVVLWIENKEVACHKSKKIHECGIKHGHHMHCHKEVKAIVAYTGHDEYEHKFPPAEHIGAIKLKAMHKFGIEASAADQYLFQHDAANLDDRVKIGSLGKCEVKLVLLRKKPQEKGYVR